jgi:hypothetical protein
MYIAPNSYIDYVKLLEAYPSLQGDMSEWLKTHTPEKDSISVYSDDPSNSNNHSPTIASFVEKWNTEEEEYHRHDWKSIPIFFKKEWNTKDFPNFSKVAKELKGLRQCLINFIAPNGKITIHKDQDNWNNMTEYWGFLCDGYSLVATLQTGMKNSKDKTVGTSIRDVNTGIDSWSYALVNEFVCFDGLNYNHAIINKTDEWRISAVFDIDKEKFDPSFIKTDRQVCDYYVN